MKITVTLLLASFLFGCSTPHNSSKVVGGWVLSKDWAGYMGVALNLKPDNNFEYWFYSDVIIDQPKFPIAGTYTVTGKEVVLKPSGFKNLYSKKWYIHSHNGQAILMPLKQWASFHAGAGVDSSRYLYFVPNFESKAPFAWQSAVEVDLGSVEE